MQKTYECERLVAENAEMALSFCLHVSRAVRQLQARSCTKFLQNTEHGVFCVDDRNGSVQLFPWRAAAVNESSKQASAEYSIGILYRSTLYRTQNTEIHRGQDPGFD